jgi:transcriptional regulator with XRE-family HTH domain
MVLVRHEIGDVLRDFRQQKGATLRQIASRANVALGYLSEVERGQKEASSEILAAIADALDMPLSVIMHEVGDRLAMFEEFVPRSSVPDTLPDELVAQFDSDMAVREAPAVTHSEFFIAVDDEFGRFQGRALVRDLVMDSLGDRTAQQALEAGVAPKRVWLALCGAMQVPLGRQHGVGLLEPLADTPG